MKDQILSAIRGRLRDRGLDAYVAYTPSNVFYATGFQSYFLMQWWRMQGTVLVVIPADEVYGRARPAAERLFGVLQEAHDRACAQIRPGVEVGEVFRVAQDHITSNGYPRFRRGHYRHSLGIDTFHEEPPYVSEGERTLIEEGMVLAIETPAYTTDAGAIMIEDLVYVLPNGIERLHKLPHELGVVS